jgi:hypothetical protein
MQEVVVRPQAQIERTLLAASWSPPGCSQGTEALVKEAGGIPVLNRVLIEGGSPPIAQQIGIPIFAATDAAIARFYGANEAFQIIVGSG